jgi:hypothetical protein
MRILSTLPRRSSSQTTTLPGNMGSNLEEPMSTLESLKETVKRELPTWLESDPAFREAILALTANRYSRRDETNDWFHQTLEEMRRERERQDARWRENDERLERERQETGMYSFERKARFYERRHQRQADPLIVISPMIDHLAQDVAKRLGIETYGEPEEVSE